MKTILAVTFNSIAKSQFRIHNPPIFPHEGEVVDFDWPQFIQDEAGIEKLEDFRNIGVWRASVLCKEYFADAVVVTVLLCEARDYCDAYQLYSN